MARSQVFRTMASRTSSVQVGETDVLGLEKRNDTTRRHDGCRFNVVH